MPRNSHTYTVRILTHRLQTNTPTRRTLTILRIEKGNDAVNEEMITDLCFLGDYFGCTEIYFLWLIRGLFNDGRRENDEKTINERVLHYVVLYCGTRILSLVESTKLKMALQLLKIDYDDISVRRGRKNQNKNSDDESTRQQQQQQCRRRMK